MSRRDPFHDPELHAAELALLDAELAVANAELADAQREVRLARAHIASLKASRSLEITQWDELEAGRYDVHLHRATTRAQLDRDEAHESWLALLGAATRRRDRGKLYEAETSARQALDEVRRRIMAAVEAGRVEPS